MATRKTSKKPARKTAPHKTAKRAAKHTTAKRRSSPKKNRQATHFTGIETAIETFQRGEPIIMTDGDDRANEGDICLPAQFVTPEWINFMSKYGRGLICVGMTGERLDKLGLPLMVEAEEGGSPSSGAFTVSVEARTGSSRRGVHDFESF